MTSPDDSMCTEASWSFGLLASKTLHYYYRPQTKFAKAMLYTCVSVHTGGCGIPACLATGLMERGGIPACLAGFQVHTQGES